MVSQNVFDQSYMGSSHLRLEACHGLLESVHAAQHVLVIHAQRPKRALSGRARTCLPRPVRLGLVELILQQLGLCA